MFYQVHADRGAAMEQDAIAAAEANELEKAVDILTKAIEVAPTRGSTRNNRYIRRHERLVGAHFPLQSSSV